MIRGECDPIVLEFLGKTPSKKNAYTPNKNGKGMHKSKDLQQALDRIAIQVPGWARDLRLESPQVSFHFTYVKANWDRDNAVTALTDILVQMGTLLNDNIKRYNGLVEIHPAIPGDIDSVKIVIIPRAKQTDLGPRYINPRRSRRVDRDPEPEIPADLNGWLEDYVEEEV